MKHLGYLCYVNTHSLNKVPNLIKVTSFEAVSKTKQNVVNLVANHGNLVGFCHFVLPLKTQPPSVVQSWHFFGDFTSSFGKMKV